MRASEPRALDSPEVHVIADVDATDLKQQSERLKRADQAFARDYTDDFITQLDGGVGFSSIRGVIELLRRHESACKVDSVKRLRTIDTPKPFQGSLRLAGIGYWLVRHSTALQGARSGCPPCCL